MKRRIWMLATAATVSASLLVGCDLSISDSPGNRTIAGAVESAVHGSAADQWHNWRGPELTGMARENAPVTSWKVDGENQLWKSDIGGRSTPIVMGGRLFFVTSDGKAETLGERVVCLDADTGRTLWEKRYSVFLTDIVENRLGWPAMVGDPETGYVYAHMTGGEFVCLDRHGNEIWNVALTERFGRISGYGGRLHTPIVDEDKVIVSFLNSSWGTQARPTHRYLALDKRTGKVIWWAAPGGAPLDTTYAMPVVAVIDGVRQLIAATADGNVYGMLARTGERLWTYKLSKRGINSSVVVDGNYAYVCHSEENIDSRVMGRVVCIDASKRGDITDSGEVWQVDGLEVGYASPAIANGRLYAVNNAAVMYCLDAKTGKQLWTCELGRVMKGSPTVTADGVIYVGTVNGRFLILRDTGEQAVLLDAKQFEREDGEIVEIFGAPAVTGGRVYFMTRYNTFALGEPDGGRPAVAVPPAPAEVAPDATRPGKLLVIPAEATVEPDEQLDFHARLFDVNGREIDAGIVGWSADDALPGHWHGSQMHVSGENAFAAGEVTAQTENGQAGTARLRVSPVLPITENFDGYQTGAVPPGWIGVFKKTEVVDAHGGRVLKKLAEVPSPPFMRIEGLVRPPLDAGYTVQCDVLGEAKMRGSRLIAMSDMGVINSRYLLVVMGSTIKPSLRIVTWAAEPRLQKDIEFDWKPETWYTIKFRVEPKGDTARLLGKVWPRGQDEPADWTIELTDPRPNSGGSPGIYGYSAGTTTKSRGPQVFYDNFKVTAND